MYNKFEQSEVDFTTLASVWGHKNPKSGTFLSKKAAMMTYGLIEGRGKVRVSETGRKIAQTPPQKKELNDGLIETISKIPLWKEVFDKYTKIGKELPTTDFWLTLRQICHVSPEEAQNKAEMVRKAYLEDITGIESPKGGDSNMDDRNDKSSEELEDQQPRAPQISKELSFLADGGLELKLLGANAKEKWKKYEAVINAYLCPKDVES
jgi:hypothetical protein